MQIERLLTMTATVYHAANEETEDLFGDAVPAETLETDWRCWISQSQRAEDTANTAQTVEVWQAFLPAAAAGSVAAGDRLVVGDDSYEVEGPPWAVTSPRTGTTTHLVLTLKRVV